MFLKIYLKILKRHIKKMSLILSYTPLSYVGIFFITRLPPEFLAASGLTEQSCASTLGAALLCSSRVGSWSGACIHIGLRALSIGFVFPILSHIEPSILRHCNIGIIAILKHIGREWKHLCSVWYLKQHMSPGALLFE